jgi:L-serine deaminase
MCRGVVETMRETGQALPSAYRDTARGGLAHTWNAAAHSM